MQRSKQRIDQQSEKENRSRLSRASSARSRRPESATNKSQAGGGRIPSAKSRQSLGSQRASRRELNPYYKEQNAQFNAMLEAATAKYALPAPQQPV